MSALSVSMQWKKWLAISAVILLSVFPSFSFAAISVIDDANHVVTLPTPAQRIISVAPHATELLYAAGAGSHLVGVSEYSNYPPEAKNITSVGGSAALDLERIVTLKPDLIIVWGSGNSAAQIEKLRALHIPLFESEPRNFEAVATSLERLGKLAGTTTISQAKAQAFRTRLQTLATTYQHRSPVRVFLQIWRHPLMTLNNQHMASAVIRLCGGENVFGQLPQIAPTVSIESVLQENPEAIIVTTNGNENIRSDWQRFPKLTAVARGNLFAINVDWMTRGGPRILDGAESLCKQLDTVRQRRVQTRE
ncbi:MAG: cobalamin-binding protein [Burkholderiaceae bacterium]